VSQPNDYLSDYQRLGVNADCSLHDLQQAWRRAVAAHHPDRAAPDSASMTLVELTQAYRRLRNFERRYGRLPGQVLPPPRANESVVRAEEMKPDAATSPPTTRSGLVLVTVVLTTAFLLLWWVERETPTGAAQSVGPAHVERTRTQAAPSRKTIRTGDSPAHVRTLLGEPILRDGEVWEYGPSHVRFERQRVVDWYSSPMAPLPVESTQDAVGTPD